MRRSGEKKTIEECIRVLQGNRTNWVCIDSCKRRFIIGMGLRGMEPRRLYVICKLETQESHWCNSVWVQKSENWAWWCKSRCESQISRTRTTDAHGQEKRDVSTEAERVHLPFLCLFLLLGPSEDWMAPTHTGDTLFL